MSGCAGLSLGWSRGAPAKRPTRRPPPYAPTAVPAAAESAPFYAPPAEEVFGFPVDAVTNAVTEAVAMPAEADRLLHQVNLMLELFGSCEVYEQTVPLHPLLRLTEGGCFYLRVHIKLEI